MLNEQGIRSSLQVKATPRAHRMTGMGPIFMLEAKGHLGQVVEGVHEHINNMKVQSMPRNPARLASWVATADGNPPSVPREFPTCACSVQSYRRWSYLHLLSRMRRQIRLFDPLRAFAAQISTPQKMVRCVFASLSHPGPALRCDPSEIAEQTLTRTR